MPNSAQGQAQCVCSLPASRASVEINITHNLSLFLLF
jgi:hypothetical protein